MDSQTRRNMANFVISSLAGELDTGSHVESMRRFEIIRALRLLISQTSLADEDQACSILQILLKDLNIEPIQPCIGNEALQALASVTHYLADVTSTNSPPQRLMRVLEDAWPQVFQWLWSQMFTLVLPPVSSDDATINSYYYSAAISVLSLYSSHPILFHVATETDTPLDLLVSRLLYIRAKRLDPSIPSAIVHLYRTYLSPQKSAPDPNSQCAALGVASSFHMLYTNFQWRDSDRDVLHSAISSTIQLLLHAPRAELSAKSPDLALVESHLAIIVALSHAEKHPYAFINNHSPSVIVKFLASLGKFSADDAFLAKCTSLCVEHLCLVLESSPGFQPILEAVDAMLLPALIKMHSRLPQLCSLTPAQHDAPSLCTILSKYLIFISFRERVAKSLSIIAKTGLEDLLPQDSSFTTAWINFKELAIERSKVITQPHRGRAKNEIVCSNITCRETKQKADLACCSRCHVAFYCSKACQVYDWKHGDHKATCVGAYDRRKNFPIGNRDMFSVDELVRSEVKLKLSEICAAWEDLSQDCIVPLVIFDLVTHPLSLTITKADPDVPPHRRTTARQTVFWKETVEMVDAERKRGVNKGILLAYIPAGAECYDSMVMITLDELRTVVFSSKPMFGLGPATVSVG